MINNIYQCFLKFLNKVLLKRLINYYYIIDLNQFIKYYNIYNID